MRRHVPTLFLGVSIIIFFTLCINIINAEKTFQRVIDIQKEEIEFFQKENIALKQQIKSLERELRESRVLSVTVTAYSPRVQETNSDSFTTASMQPVKEGSIAVSRDLFYSGWVFGREVYIEGHGIFVITDLMHERKTQQIDIFRFNTNEALKFGRKTLRVALLD